MKKIYGITLGFCPSKVLALGLEALSKTKSISMMHYYLHQHYPLNEIQNKKECMDLCDKYGLLWRDSELDRGLAGGFNYWLDLIKPDPDSYILGLDPDMNPPSTPGWDKALVDILDADPTLAWVSCGINCIPNNIKGGWLKGKYVDIAGHKCFAPNYIDMINITLWRTSFFLAEPRGMSSIWQYYGGIERPLRDKSIRMGMYYVYAMNLEEGPSFGHLGDKEYMDYKTAHIHGFKGSFKDFLSHLKP